MHLEKKYLLCPMPFQYHFLSGRVGVVSWSPILAVVYPVAWPEQHRTCSESCWLRQAFETCALSKVTDSCWKQRLHQEIGLPSPFWQMEEQRREAAGRMRKNPVLWASLSQSSVHEKLWLLSADFRSRPQRFGDI